MKLWTHHAWILNLVRIWMERFSHFIKTGLANFFSVERRTWIKHDLRKKAKIIIRPFAQPLEATRQMNRNFFPRGNRIMKFPEQFQSKKIADPELKNMILILKLWNVQPYFIHSVKISNASNLFLTLEFWK